MADGAPTLTNTHKHAESKVRKTISEKSAPRRLGPRAELGLPSRRARGSKPVVQLELVEGRIMAQKGSSLEGFVAGLPPAPDPGPAQSPASAGQARKSTRTNGVQAGNALVTPLVLRLPMADGDYLLSGDLPTVRGRKEYMKNKVVEPHKMRELLTIAYRESSAQTHPWQPEAIVAPNCESTPEVLFLDELKWGPGEPYRLGDLPADFHTTEIINKMRHTRAWYNLIETGKLPSGTKRRDAVIVDVEDRSWLFREAVSTRRRGILIFAVKHLAVHLDCVATSGAPAIALRCQIAGWWRFAIDNLTHVAMANDTRRNALLPSMT
ncbi:hypothetical protein EVAR_40760_1 [Eumeta japonica]|uniref:Cilia- and flagella-associated protein 91 n=1 Tax=Eumeta variegata TaxID=151549 RepID=A0A4C1X7C7_EUMVA|nr:hypothetical protein EVAR_40760_1 [Eumeta japonica]